MTQEFINRLFAALLNKDFFRWEWIDGHGYGWVGTELKVKWSPSSDGEITKEVRDFMAEKWPERWEKYLEGYAKRRKSAMIEAQLSIEHLTQFILDQYEHKSGMFFEECPDKNYGDDICITDSMLDCPVEGGCNGTGLILKPEMVEAGKIIEGEKK